jgi:hypothetical protein
VRSGCRLLAAVTIFVGGCGEVGGSMSTPESTAREPGSPQVRLSAMNLFFVPTLLQVPADSEFVLVFDNRERDVAHNFAIFTDPTASEVLFRGVVVSGPVEHRYRIPALTPGEYFFRCDLHPETMTGRLIAR